LPLFTQAIKFNQSSVMLIDANTRNSLELLKSISGMF
jgi:hypothetical protein